MKNISKSTILALGLAGAIASPAVWAEALPTSITIYNDGAQEVTLVNTLLQGADWKDSNRPPQLLASLSHAQVVIDPMGSGIESAGGSMTYSGPDGKCTIVFDLNKGDVDLNIENDAKCIKGEYEENGERRIFIHLDLD